MGTVDTKSATELAVPDKSATKEKVINKLKQKKTQTHRTTRPAPNQTEDKRVKFLAMLKKKAEKWKTRRASKLARGSDNEEEDAEDLDTVAMEMFIKLKNVAENDDDNLDEEAAKARDDAKITIAQLNSRLRLQGKAYPEDRHRARVLYNRTRSPKLTIDSEASE